MVKTQSGAVSSTTITPYLLQENTRLGGAAIALQMVTFGMCGALGKVTFTAVEVHAVHLRKSIVEEI